MVVRKNTKVILVEPESSIVKSNEISLAKLNHGLSLNQVQLLAYFIYSTQRKGGTSFQKIDFEKRFNLKKYKGKHAIDDIDKLSMLRIAIRNDAKEKANFWPIFQHIGYDNGTFTYTWNEKFLPHIINLQGNYIINNLNITSNFKSSYSWILYEVVKALNGLVHKKFTKEEMLMLFNVEHVATYVKNTGRFKQSVLDVATKEVSELTEVQITYTEIREGKKVIGFDLKWSVGDQLHLASQEFLFEIESIVDVVHSTSHDILFLDVKKAQDRAMELFREFVEKEKEFKAQKKMQKETAEKYYSQFKDYLGKIQDILDRPEAYRTGFYNWLDEREK